MKKTAIKMISLLMALVTLFTFMPLSTQAEESTIKVEAPVIEIRTDRTAYGVYESARVTVEVSPSNEYAVEDVFIGASIDGQLVAVKGGEFSKEIDMLTGETVCRFDVALSSNASGLNIFQKIIMFFKKLFGKGHSAVEIPEYNFNDGRAKVSESIDISFSSITGTVTVNVWYKDEIETTDTDGDGLIDYVEKANGLNPNKADTDNDGLSDYDEFVIIGTDPTKADTDGNGVNDFEDDNDADGLSNGEEIEIGTSANSSDTDGDGLNDKEELETYYTEPSNEDTDGDGATDGWEVENGFDPKNYNSSFAVNAECENDDLIAKVSLSANGEVAESLKVEPAKETVHINSTIPGYLGNAFNFMAEGKFEKAELSFEFDQALLEDPDFIPAIYYLNEETGTFDELETIVKNNVATAWTDHFSTYTLLNKKLYVDSVKASGAIDLSLDDGTDSNNDGITDYLTKLMCDGIIRTGTGTLVFNGLSYEEVQKTNDIDNDGIINGEEIMQNQRNNEIPEEAIEYNGHYYMYFDAGYSWKDSKTYCENIGGHLLTVGTQEENDFAFSLIKNGRKKFYWLGATDVLKENDWHWVTEEVWIYTGWSGYFDNGYSGGEDYAALLRVNSWGKAGQWNDFTNEGSSDSVSDFGFICEWGDFSVCGKYYITLISSPILGDTDRDGIFDYKDTEPLKQGLKGGIVGALTICSYGDGAASFAGFDGHAYVAYTSFITEEITLYGIKVDSPDNVAKENDSREDRPQDHTFTISSNSVVSIGGWAGWLPNELKGSWINNEYMLFGNSVPSDQISLTKYITNTQKEKMIKSVKNHSKWTVFYNCSAFAADVWNDTLNDNISPYGPWASPKSLAYNIQKREGYRVEASMLAEWPK